MTELVIISSINKATSINFFPFIWPDRTLFIPQCKMLLNKGIYAKNRGVAGNLTDYFP